MQISVDGNVASTKDNAIALIFDSENERTELIEKLSKGAAKVLYLIPLTHSLSDVEEFFGATAAGTQSRRLVNA